MSIYLGVNIDHIATLRQARKTRYPSPVEAALMAETAGADSSPCTSGKTDATSRTPMSPSCARC